MADHDMTTLADWLAAHQAPKEVALVYPDDADPGMPISELQSIAAVGVDGAITVKVLTVEFEKFRTGPRLYAGTAKAHDLGSFVAHVNRFKDADSALWCDVNMSEPSLTAVLDYHEAINRAPIEVTHGEDGGADTAMLEIGTPRPRFGQHRSLYRFPLSPEWLAWTGANKKPMSQTDFAAFLEDRILDVIDRQPADLSARMQDMAKLLGGHFASPARLIELSRGMAVHSNERMKQSINLDSGESSIQFEVSNTDADNKPLKVPNLFLIAIPIWRSGEVYVLPVRLRYRAQGGAIVWHYEIAYLQESFEAAVKDAALQAQAQTKLPLFFGAPEAVAPRS